MTKEQVGDVLKTYEFSINHISETEKNAPLTLMQDYKIMTEIHHMPDEKATFSLRIDTQMSFSQTLKYFRMLGISDKTMVKVFQYSTKTKVVPIANPESEFRFKQISKTMISNINRPNINDVYFGVESEPGKGADLYYKRISYHDFITEQNKQKTTIGYICTEIVKPRFDDVLKASLLKLSSPEKKMLEQMIENGLRL